MDEARLSELKDLASRIRYKTVELSHLNKAPHLAPALSCTDILVAAYWEAMNFDTTKPDDPLRDRLIFSKGHAAIGLYSVLCHRGFFPMEVLDTFTKKGSPLAEQPAPFCAPGVELATGSLGHGLPVGIGQALAAKIRKQNYKVIVVMGDGECNEGTVWEGALVAPAKKLDNLAVVVDYNKLQATGRSQEITALHPLKEKWEAFGWDAHEVDGHDIAAIAELLSRVPTGSGKPMAIVANTVKGKGVSFMEDDNNWHYRTPNQEELVKAGQELGVTS